MRAPCQAAAALRNEAERLRCSTKLHPDSFAGHRQLRKEAAVGRDPHTACPSSQAERRGWPLLGGIALCSAGTRVPGRGRPWAATTELERGQAARCHPNGAARCDGVTPIGIARCGTPVSHRRHPSPRCHPPWSPGHGCIPRAERPRIPTPQRPAPPAPRRMRRHRPAAAAVRGRAGPPLRFVRRLLGPQLPAARAGGARAAPAGTAPGGTACGPRATHRPPGPALRCGRPRPSPLPRAPAPQPPHRATGSGGAAAGGDGGRSEGTGLRQSGCGGRDGGPGPRGRAMHSRRAGARRCDGVKLQGCGHLGRRECRLQGYRTLGRRQAGCRSRCSPRVWVTGMRAAWGAGSAGFWAPVGTRGPGGARSPGPAASSAPAVRRSLGP